MLVCVILSLEANMLTTWTDSGNIVSWDDGQLIIEELFEGADYAHYAHVISQKVSIDLLVKGDSD